MQIQISQHKISIGNKYDIAVNGVPSFKAESKIFRIMAEININDITANDNDARIKRLFKPFMVKYKINSKNYGELLFDTVSYWKNHYCCVVGMDKYEVFEHRGRKVSIFKNDKQIAAFKRKSVSIAMGDEYTVHADDDADANLLVCFCIICDNFNDAGKDKGLINLNLGNLFQARRFDEAWQINTRY
jgi:uncharacterized protein YxjI